VNRNICGTLRLVQIALRRGVRRGAERTENPEHLVLLDKAPGLLDRLWRAVAVVESDEVDFAAVDPALIVDHPVKGRLRAPDRGEGGSRTAIGDCLADLDLDVGNTRCRLALGRLRMRSDCPGESGDKHQPQQEHGLSLPISMLILPRC
jgi:hypothetical protein